ncbi:PfkB family carbohydrate kinase, partial [Enterobacter hormaechei]
LLLNKTGWTAEELDDRVGTRITTRGGKSVVIVEKGAEPLEVGIVPSDNLLDPTGVGDAFRAGFLTGVVDGLSLERSAQFGALIATHVLETTG